MTGRHNCERGVNYTGKHGICWEGNFISIYKMIQNLIYDILQSQNLTNFLKNQLLKKKKKGVVIFHCHLLITRTPTQ